ncbi:MAG: hypothetical protein JST32_00195 [Bacteroidetes bacterium]|nr:hypothetical protein [Bacteroidota bacterium]
MNKVLILIVSLSLKCFFCLGQHLELRKDTSLCKKSAVVVLKNVYEEYISTPEIFSAVDPTNIASVYVTHPTKAVKRYGPNAKNGVIQISLKKHVDLLDIDHLYRWYNIQEKYRNLPVYLDSTIICRPNNVYFSPLKIKYVRVEKENYTGLSYISIRTTEPITQPGKDGISLRGKAKR